MTKIREQIRIQGIVQGVGFRPFVFRLARQYKLTGFVLNDTNGVLIEVEGGKELLEKFIADLQLKAPPMARITLIQSHAIPPIRDDHFKILQSQSTAESQILITPDMAICDDCLRELFDSSDRRYHYPFINCINCGPRYTITRAIPYDRPNTSMAPFTLCPECQKEYDDPHNRRFHAQPNACPVCGPQLVLKLNDGVTFYVDDPIQKTIELLHKGYIIAIRGLGGFHLCVDAQNDTAVRHLRLRKRREEKPLAVMAANLDVIERFALLSNLDRRFLQSPECPIVLAAKKNPFILAESVAPGNAFIGVMLPYTPLQHLLVREGFTALVMTSGNLSEEPIAIGNEEAIRRLAEIADFFLLHDREILLRSDDSVVRTLDNRLMPIRRARGFVPVPIFLQESIPAILAVGGELKNTICLTKGRHAFLSQHIGDLENMETLEFFAESIQHLQQIMQIQPERIAYDHHPEYLATQWAVKQTHLTRIGVQHHHAHIAACLAENHCQEPVIGLAMDGTGLGTDGAIWGGEILLADCVSFERAGHFDYVPMPGGTMAIKEPWRMLFGFLYHYWGSEILYWPVFTEIESEKLAILQKMITNKVNTPMTSSLGRLFDAISALVGLGKKTAFEGQAAMKLEMAMYEKSHRIEDIQVRAYPYEITQDHRQYIISVRPMFQPLIEDWLNHRPIAEISGKFHHLIVNIFCDLCEQIRYSQQINSVALSGGCFQNYFLSTLLPQRLEGMGFKVLTHQLVPPNDGGLSLGQAVIAAHQR